ncbi:MAG: leucine-rich repeat protein, partial [Lachnospirales bacterium]
LTKIEIPDSVTTCLYAFNNCTNLIEVKLSTNLKMVCGFSGCENLKSISMPEGLTILGAFAFGNCRSLTSVVIPEGTTYIEAYTFGACTSLTSVKIPKSVTYVSDAAFSGCTDLTTVYCYKDSAADHRGYYINSHIIEFIYLDDIGYQIGDVNGDGNVTSLDAALVLQYVLNGSNTITTENADVNKNGVIDSEDVAMILQKALDSSYKLPGEPDTETTTEVTTEITTETTTEVATETTTETTTDFTKLTYYPKSQTGDWIATVSGSVGGQEKLTTIKKHTVDEDFNPMVVETAVIDLISDYDGNSVPAWEINAKGDNAVNIKAGTINTSENSIVNGVGKVANSEEGMAYYGQWVDSSKDFVISATATINQIANRDNQVAFGISAIDDLVVDSHYPDATSLIPPKAEEVPPYADSINVGRSRMNSAGKNMTKGWYRIDGQLYGPDTSRADYLDESLAAPLTMTAPVPNDVYYLRMEKTGSIYILSISKNGEETEKTVIDASAGHGANNLSISLTGDIFVGVSATRAIDVDFTDIRLQVTDHRDTVSVVDKDYVWKAAMFGASSLGFNLNNTNSSEITATINGTEYKSNRTEHSIEPQIMTDGKLPTVDSVRLNSWNGCGKVSGDQDGIAYYYTRVSNKNNFKISADITVNRYIRDISEILDEDNISDQNVRDNYNKYLAEAKAEGLDDDAASAKALDRLRSGQEAFGIIAKDTIPLAGGIDENINYTGDSNHITADYESAMKKYIDYTTSDDLAKSIETPVDIYEAYINGYVVKDGDGVEYSASMSDVCSVFCSNMVLAGGCTNSTYPSSDAVPNYEEKINMNRINIMMRKGVSSYDGAGERVGIKTTTDELPLAGNKYHISLEKINGGYMITTYDYQTGNTVTEKDFESDFDCSNLLGIQDNDNIYVGFFAARYADCTVSNIELYETEPVYIE